MRGGTARTRAEVTLTTGELITRVEGTSSGSAFTKILFVTNKGM